MTACFSPVVHLKILHPDNFSVSQRLAKKWPLALMEREEGAWTHTPSGQSVPDTVFCHQGP